MDSINAQILISSDAQKQTSEDIFYQITHIADVTTWYHRQVENEDESFLVNIEGNHINTLTKSKLSIHLNDTINIYLVCKNHILNGGCHTNSHLMITLNFDIFDSFFKLNKNNFRFQDLINIENQVNKDKVNMLYMSNFSNSAMRFNLLNYEIPVYNILNNLYWLNNQFVNIKIYDIYENDVTSFVRGLINCEKDRNYQVKITDNNTNKYSKKIYIEPIYKKIKI